MRQILFVPGLLGSRLRYYGPERQPLIWPMTGLDPERALALLALDDPEAPAVLADGLIEGEYDALLALLSEHADVVTPAAYDWRRSIEGAARSALARLREDASEIVVVTHSMGGNVVRAMLAAASGRPVVRKISRIVALGAPWWGSAVSYHAATYGRAPSFRLPQSFGEERLRRTLSTFTSLQQLMPAETYWRRYERYRGQHGGQPGERNGEQRPLDASDHVFEGIELIEVVGTGVGTVCDLAERPAEADGDGIVPIFAAGHDAGAPLVRVEAAHHELPAHPAVLEAVERAVKRRGAGRWAGAAPAGSAARAHAPSAHSPSVRPPATGAPAGPAPQQRRPPIAIIGVGCRFPGGVRDLESFWRILESGVDGIVDIPPERWDLRRFYDEDPDRPGKMYVRQAGFLKEDVRSFDPLCFGISPREAESLDPQQMLLLETAWEAMEDAGIPASALRGSDTGVFIGGFCLDNKLNNLSLLNRELLGPHSGTGATMAVLSNRLSYTFDLRGPSLSIDTACSSSLVAIHYACESIWRGECPVAFAGGVNVMLRPEYFIAMCKGHFLSHHARCKAFDADAAGYVRGEGAGVVLLKPLEQALRDGDPVHAVILATGVNQDGQTPGLPVPSADAQEALIRQVCARAGVSPGDVAYVEAHGTGTQAGDPREAKALHQALSEGRDSSRPCWVGSVKTNIGHLEAAAGVAGLIKAALVLKKRVVPPNLHFNTPNPAIPFDRYCIRVPTQAVPLTGGNGPLIAGVNSFGYGGTNAHVLLQEAPAMVATAVENSALDGSPAEDPAAARVHAAGAAAGPATWRAAWRPGLPFIFPLSAHTDGALRRRAAQYAEWIEKERPAEGARMEAWLRDLLYSAARRRDHLPVRAAVVASDVDGLVRALRAFAEAGTAQGVVYAPRLEDTARPAFIFTGMGPQWHAMGRELMDAFPGFLETVRRLDAAFREVAGWSILEEMQKDEASSRMGETWVAQPANFVLQVALTELLGEWGIRPEAITGHSVGEVTAAYAGGALSLEDAVSVSFHRSRLQHTLAGRGGMLAVGCTLEEATARIEGKGDVSVAAINSRSNITLAGAKEPLDAIAAELEREGLFARFLRVDIPYHSPVMEEIRKPLLESLAAIAPQSGGLDVYSTVTGDRMAGEAFAAGYWYRNVREPVRFEGALRSMLRDGYNIFVEVGPHPVLSAAVAETLRSADYPAVHIATLRRREPEVARLLAALAEWYVRGLPVHWERIYPAGKWLALPHYPFERRRFDVQSVANAQDLRGAADSDHPWLVSRVPDPTPTWDLELRPPFLPYLHEHRVEGAIVFPAAGYVEAGLALAAAEAGLEACRLENVRFEQALIVDPKRLQDLRMRYFSKEGRFEVSSRLHGGEAEDTWQVHAGGIILAPFDGAEPPEVDLAAWREACTEPVDPAHLYERLERAGLAYGSAFRTIRSLWVGGRRNVVRLERAEKSAPAGRDERLPPVLLDGAFQSLFGVVASGGERLKPYVPYSVERITFYRTPGAACWVSAVVHSYDEQEIRADLLLAGDDGRLCVEVKGLCCRALDAAADAGTVRTEIRYADVWQRVPDPGEEGGAAELESAGQAAGGPGGSWHWYSPDPEGKVWAELARTAGARTMRVHRSLDALLDGVAASLGSGSVRVVWMAAPPAGAPAEGRPHDWSERAALLSDGLARLVRRLRPDAAPAEEPPVQIDVVTMGTQPVVSAADVVHPADAALWGVAAVAVNEYEGLVIRRCDLPARPEERDRKRWLKWLFDTSAPRECAVREGTYWERALAPLAREEGDGAAAGGQLVSTTEPLELRIDRPGKIDDLYFRRVSRRPPGPGEIEILVHHAALNYKDLLKALGQISGEVLEGTYFGRDLGMESAGVVVAVGEGVTRFKPGDEVVASVSGFRTYATVPEVYAVRKPRNLSFAEAPVYLGYMTAYYGLMYAARLAPGESVLIHNATGGVGLAAVQIALWAGAEVFATAGTEEKREYLRRLGIKHVYHSRSTRFVDEIRRDTNGRGVDVVLNAIAGETLDKSLGLLASFGRFIEIGKRDIGENRGLPMGAFDRNLTFAAVDLDRMFAERPDISNRLIWEITDHIEKGHFGPMPVTEFPAARAHEAFRMMSQSRHIGKIVLRFAGEKVPVRTGTGDPAAVVRPDGAYLVTGGTSGLGLEIGRHLAAAGAGRVVLVSRRGMTPDCRRLLDGLDAARSRVEVRALDVTDRAQVRELVAGLQAAGMPLRGVFHCAMVLDDDNLSRLDLERFRRVIAPKVGGLRALVEALGLGPGAGEGGGGAKVNAGAGVTARGALDFFVMFSSISSIIGNPGQANYVAANSVLDAAAHYLAAAGVRAVTVNLGVLSEVGVASRNERLESVLEAAGIRGLPPAEAVRGTIALLEEGAVQAGLFDVDWSKFAAAYPAMADSPRFRALAGAFSQGSRSDENSWAHRLAGLSPEEQEALLCGRIREILGRILRLPPDSIPADAPISRLGMDSLMAIELRHLLKEEFGTTFTTLELLRGPRVTELAAALLSSWKLADVVMEAV